MSVFINS